VALAIPKLKRNFTESKDESATEAVPCRSNLADVFTASAVTSSLVCQSVYNLARARRPTNLAVAVAGAFDVAAAQKGSHRDPRGRASSTMEEEFAKRPEWWLRGSCQADERRHHRCT
jgi:hypothetical protein